MASISCGCYCFPSTFDGWSISNALLLLRFAAAAVSIGDNAVFSARSFSIEFTMSDASSLGIDVVGVVGDVEMDGENVIRELNGGLRLSPSSEEGRGSGDALNVLLLTRSLFWSTN